MFMANPTSDFFNAGASFVPSPVTATVQLSYFSPVTRMNLSSGDERARTLSYSLTKFMFLSCLTLGYNLA